MVNDAALVIPTIRDLDFLDTFGDQLNGMRIIVCEDHEYNDIKLTDEMKDRYNITIHPRSKMREELGDSAWIIPNFNASIRSFGYWKAWKEGYKYILTLDDDCFLWKDNPNWLGGHIYNLQHKSDFGYEKTAPFYTRGFPYAMREESPVMVSHGLWANVADFDGPTQLVLGKRAPQLNLNDVNKYSKIIPRGSLFAMCGMNLAFHRDVTPAMYFLLQGRDYEFDRFDDIWAGYFVKKICDHMGWSVATGGPAIYHSRASDPFANTEKEAHGIRVNEKFWEYILNADLGDAKTVQSAYFNLALKVAEFPHNTDYFKSLCSAMTTWLKLFDEPA